MNGVIVGKLDGKVAVITGATSGMALAGAKLFVDEGAHVFITGRRKDELDQAVELIGRNVTGVASDLTTRRQSEVALEQANRKLTEWVHELEARSRETTVLAEMGDLLLSCLTAEEAYAVIGAVTPKLFPAASGALGVLGMSRLHVRHKPQATARIEAREKPMRAAKGRGSSNIAS